MMNSFSAVIHGRKYPPYSPTKTAGGYALWKPLSSVWLSLTPLEEIARASCMTSEPWPSTLTGPDLKILSILNFVSTVMSYFLKSHFGQIMNSRPVRILYYILFVKCSHHKNAAIGIQVW